MPKLSLWTASLLVFALAQGAMAQSPGPPRGECHKLTRQIARYEGDLERAEERGNQLWARANERQLARLNHRLAERCPEHVPPTFAQRMGATLDAVGRAALKVLPLLH